MYATLRPFSTLVSISIGDLVHWCLLTYRSSVHVFPHARCTNNKGATSWACLATFDLSEGGIQHAHLCVSQHVAGRCFYCHFNLIHCLFLQFHVQCWENRRTNETVAWRSTVYLNWALNSNNNWKVPRMDHSTCHAVPRSYHLPIGHFSLGSSGTIGPEPTRTRWRSLRNKMF